MGSTTAQCGMVSKNILYVRINSQRHRAFPETHQVKASKLFVD